MIFNFSVKWNGQSYFPGKWVCKKNSGQRLACHWTKICLVYIELKKNNLERLQKVREKGWLFLIGIKLKAKALLQPVPGFVNAIRRNAQKGG